MTLAFNALVAWIIFLGLFHSMAWPPLRRVDTYSVEFGNSWTTPRPICSLSVAGTNFKKISAIFRRGDVMLRWLRPQAQGDERASFDLGEKNLLDIRGAARI